MRQWQVRRGGSRIVILTMRSAYKLPRFGWRRFLTGLLGNMDEVTRWKQGLPRLCPVKWYIPGGWVLAMPRAEGLTEQEAEAAHDEYIDLPGPKVDLMEFRADNFGKLNGQWVVIDYADVR